MAAEHLCLFNMSVRELPNAPLCFNPSPRWWNCRLWLFVWAWVQQLESQLFPSGVGRDSNGAAKDYILDLQSPGGHRHVSKWNMLLCCCWMLNKQLLDDNYAIWTQIYSCFPTCFWCPQVAKIVTLQDYGPLFFLWIMCALSAHADLVVIDKVVPEDSKTWQMAYVDHLITVIAAEVSGGKHDSKYLFP